MSGYTRGPWKIADRKNSEGTDGRFGIWNDDVFVATTCSDISIDDDKDESIERANARLIAAAPIGHELISRAISDRIDDKWLKDARAYLAKVAGHP